MVSWYRKWKYPDYPFCIREELDGYGRTVWNLQGHLHHEMGYYWSNLSYHPSLEDACYEIKIKKEDNDHRIKQRVVKSRIVTCKS